MNREELQVELGERFKYLFINQFKGVFEVMSFTCEIIEMHEDKIKEFEISMSIDSLDSSGDGIPRDWYRLMASTDEKIVSFFYQYGYDNETGTVRNSDLIEEKYHVEYGFFVECELKWDELHKFYIIYKIIYGQ